MRTVRNGDTVRVDYIGSVDKKIFDTTIEEVARENGVYNNFIVYEPKQVKVGSGKMIRGFENALFGMKENEEKEIIVKPEEGYGLRHEKLVLEMPREKFAKKEPIMESDTVTLNLPDRKKLSARIIKIEKDKVIVDANHKLAGKNLNFKIILKEFVI